ncbi:hypothetical protein KKC1_17440 [Calderihabitans maritimus]|uniref:Uncharacterized protein n=1 Tax=Calderihabitans maritimus TaxID=1246530 RepID=A0A1Z5HST7_9FIRM|nr:hypothetical protein KKC1_17440 [Calderihabitans maritimus]
MNGISRQADLVQRVRESESRSQGLAEMITRELCPETSGVGVIG